MTNDEESPTTVEITVWRNLLDAFGQVSAAWEAARDAQAEYLAEAGEESPTLPTDLMSSFARAGQHTSEALTGLATVLGQQGTDEGAFARVTHAEGAAREQWAAAHRALAE